MDEKIKTRRFASFLKSSMKSAKPRIYLQEIADSIDMSPQYINQITTGKLLPPQKTFDLIIEVLQPRLDEDIMYRIIDMYDEAKYGKSVTGESRDNLSSGEMLLLKLFSQLKPDQQVDIYGILNQYIEDNRTQMLKNAKQAGFVEEDQASYSADKANKGQGGPDSDSDKS
jgi:hypothetical protein